MKRSRRRGRPTHLSPGIPVSPVAGIDVEKHTPVAKLLPELWALILGSFPIKFLLTLRCVSKSWRSIIDNPNFIRFHFNLRSCKSHNNFVLTWESCMSNSGKPGDKILLRRTHDFSVCDQILTVHPRRFEVDYLGYAQGLFLLNVSNNWSTWSLMLYNPSIRKFLALPPSPPSVLNCSAMDWHYLVFDLRSNDHKVLKFHYMKDRSAIFVASYALSTGHWEVMSEPEMPPPKNFYIASPDNAPYGTKLPVPCDITGVEVIKHFLLGDSTAVLTVSSTRLCIWVLNKSEGNCADSWSKWHDGPIDSDTYETFKLGCYENGVHLDICYAAEIEKLLLIVDWEPPVRSFDLKTHMMEELETPLPRYYVIRIAGPYRESLLLSEGVGLHSLNSLLPQRGR